MNLQLSGKKALVMGSSSGIGRAVAASLLGEGAEVAICARDGARLEKTAKELGCKTFLTCDLSQAGAAAAVTKKCIENWGGLDILVTNTGGPKRGSFADISNEQWRHDFQNIWMSVVESVQVALPRMKEQGYGRILMITSFAAREPREALTTSNGLRAGLNGLCRSISNEYARFGITINALLPGFTNTDRLKEIALPEEKIKQMIPAWRLGQPEELASLATFLASPLAGYITGENIAVDGGALKSY